MSKPDFEKMAAECMGRLIEANGGPVGRDVIAVAFGQMLGAVFDAGLERAAEIADEDATSLSVARSNASAFNDRRESERLDAAASAVSHVATAIRAEKSQ